MRNQESGVRKGLRPWVLISLPWLLSPDSWLLPAAAQNVPAYQSGQVLPNVLAKYIGYVATNAALKAAAVVDVETQVYRAGFYAAGDGGGAFYTYSTTDCSLAAGAGDNGLQVEPDAGGGCWIGSFPTAGASLAAWGACLGGADDANAINAAISANPVGRLLIPAANCTFTSAPLAISTSHVALVGVGHGKSVLRCRTGATDCLSVTAPGGANTASNSRAVSIHLSGFTIDATGQIGGKALLFQGVFASGATDVWIVSPYNGFYAWNTNDIKYQNSDIISPTGQYGLLWDTDPGLELRSDLLTLRDVIINCNFTGADGIVWDGFTQSLNLNNGAVLNCAHNLYIKNSRGSSDYPGFLAASGGWSADGASNNAIRISGGQALYFTGVPTIDNAPGRPGQGNADGPVVQIDADSGRVFNVKFTGSYINNGSKECILDNARYNFYIGNQINFCSRSAPNAYSHLRFGSTATTSQVCGNMIGDGTAKYAIEEDPGSAFITICPNGNQLIVGSETPGWLGAVGGAAR
jgi:hypothetical protein